MLLHLIPRLYAFRSIEDECSLIDFECPTLGIFLRNGVVAQMPVAAEVGSGDERDELGSG
ncbi:DUF6012 family protein (plasmid) [Comamonas thiooxydans]|nr:DUF6012 family protein [Comamonas thiooxydans]UBQ44554.1 DUF6012 family protein [Comamonas thiooxydans]